MKSLLQILVSAAVLLWTASTSAQVTLDQFSPAPTLRDGFAVSRPDAPGHLRPGMQFVLDYAKDPLVLEVEVNGVKEPNSVIISDQLVGHGVFSLALFDRLLVFAHLPVTFLMNGDRLSSSLGPDGAALGNVGLGGRLRLLGDPDDLFALGAQVVLGMPTARWANDHHMFAGERSATGHFQLLAELRGQRLRVTSNLGARVLKSDVSGLHVDNMLTFGLGAAYGILREGAGPVGAGRSAREQNLSVDLVAEMFGTSPFQSFGVRSSSPMEFLVGPKVMHTSGLGGGLAAGAALSHGYGAPAYRVLASLGWLKPNPPDRDHDGIPDAKDMCPDEPEDRDDFQDQDGCPERDNDRDGVLDVNDLCPLEPEDLDGFEDADGCPEGDNDHDGILDGVDSCPSEPEDRDGYEDSDGCPEPEADTDGDSILDTLDACPLEAETKNGNEDEDGCPDKIRVDRKQGQILILEPVQFAFNSAQILPASFDMLNEIVAVMQAHPEIASLSIEGHTDSVGSDLHNQILSEERAQSVREYLIHQGIAAERLAAQGYGETRPIADNNTVQGRDKNRRVEFRM